MLLSLIFGLVIGAVSVIFALQNVFPVTVTFLVWNVTSSLAVLISLSILVGILICALLSIPEAVKNSFRISALKKENQKLADELAMVQRVRNETPIITPVETIVVERQV